MRRRLPPPGDENTRETGGGQYIALRLAGLSGQTFAFLEYLILPSLSWEIEYIYIYPPARFFPGLSQANGPDLLRDDLTANGTQAEVGRALDAAAVVPAGHQGAVHFSVEANLCPKYAPGKG